VEGALNEGGGVVVANAAAFLVRLLKTCATCLFTTAAISASAAKAAKADANKTTNAPPLLRQPIEDKSSPPSALPPYMLKLKQGADCGCISSGEEEEEEDVAVASTGEEEEGGGESETRNSIAEEAQRQGVATRAAVRRPLRRLNGQGCSADATAGRSSCRRGHGDKDDKDDKTTEPEQQQQQQQQATTWGGSSSSSCS